MKESEDRQSVLNLVDASNLRDLNARFSFVSYCTKLWQRRSFINADARSRALSSGRETFLGNVWILLNPLLQVLLYVLVFGIVLKTNRGIENFVGFLVIGVTFFGFITQGLTSGSGLLQSSKSMITSFSFPKAAVPLSRSLRNCYDTIVPALVAIVIALAFEPSFKVSWTLLLTIPIFCLMAIFSTGLMLIAARMTTFIPDTKSLFNLVNRGLFFLSGIFFSVERFDGHIVVQNVMTYNPVYQYLTAMREVVMSQSSLSLGNWAYITVWAVATFILGLVYFWGGEERYVNHL
ncbi:ABC transporter permease [Corynebacterium guaraldiae]|uniref:ABC transporter permease n=1 Tax=Corynebacterium guaraldiae TaxID=3051103 RepID=UPI0012B8C487|nr:ABC transporter permease [Corynebacterium guaraldiae]MTD98619.1 ABC transporter permease [Corynebacterium guaraldiae]